MVYGVPHNLIGTGMFILFSFIVLVKTGVLKGLLDTLALSSSKMLAFLIIILAFRNADKDVIITCVIVGGLLVANKTIVSNAKELLPIILPYLPGLRAPKQK